MIPVVVIGASGYTGVELVGLLARHPHVTLAGLFGSPGRAAEAVPFSSVAPALRGVVDQPLQGFDLAAIDSIEPAVAILATPHEASAGLAPELLARSIRVIDISGAFRLADPALYPAHYGFEHPGAALLGAAVYGLPEAGRDKLDGASLVAVAGCYPTSVIIPVKALMAAGAIAGGTRVIVDATSGVSGAGRHAKLGTSFCEVSLSPYNVLRHRHEPEMVMHSGASVLFTPHLGAFDRGILSTIHVELAPGWDGATVREALDAALGAEPFVRLLPSGEWPSVKDVRGTNFIDIGLAEREGHLVVVSAIDNLVKGASGQAVQCMNAAIGLDETVGLLHREAVTA